MVTNPKEPYIPKEIQKLIKPPQISDETMKEMADFFMKTSVPRIAERIRLESKKKEEKE